MKITTIMPIGRRMVDCGLPPIELDLYKLYPGAPNIVPAGVRRSWMDTTSKSYAYRCTPMIMANVSGWEVVMPFGVIIEWSGGMADTGITILSDQGSDRVYDVVCSHFGHGIVTFKLGWLLRTPPGWAVWARGSPNRHKDGIVPLEGVTETDWLPFSFTMNWRFTRPGRVVFKKDEPFCFFTIFPHGIIDGVVPVKKALEDDKDLERKYSEWLNSRMAFVKNLRSDNNRTSADGWEKRYLLGDGVPNNVQHIKKRKLNGYDQSKDDS